MRIQAQARRRQATRRVETMKEKEKKKKGPTEAGAADPETEAAAVRIQAQARRRQAARRVKSMRRRPLHRDDMVASQRSLYGGSSNEDVAAVRIQAAARRRQAKRRVQSLRHKRQTSSSRGLVGRGDADPTLGATVATLPRVLSDRRVHLDVLFDEGSGTLCALASPGGASLSVPAAAVVEGVSPGLLAVLAHRVVAERTGTSTPEPVWVSGSEAAPIALRAQLLGRCVLFSTGAGETSSVAASPSRVSVDLTMTVPRCVSSRRILRLAGELTYCRCVVVPPLPADLDDASDDPGSADGTAKGPFYVVLLFMRQWDGAEGHLVLSPAALAAFGAFSSPTDATDALAAAAQASAPPATLFDALVPHLCRGTDGGFSVHLNA